MFLCYYLDMPHLAHQKHRQNKKHRTALNQLVLFIAIVEPLMTLPQAYAVWIHHNSAGVSLATWSFFALAAGVWLVYGLTIKNIPH